MYSDNVYDSPEKFGLSIVASIDLEEPDYSFDMLVVWKDVNNNLYYATDSGCSCPSPFEWANRVSDLTKLTSLNEVDHILNGGHPSPEDRSRFIYKVIQELNSGY